ncbi:MAG: LytTR family transcriptional regulator DNA-binding domain-containing protein [Alteromonadaceae bacterium]|nr:LytTR family transcriptional regulator DNA-binding domain-containing protein [Alteromonadaceae bacterium]
MHASSNYIEVHLQDRIVLHREYLSKLEDILPENQFLRVHRSSIVNICVIKNIHSDLGRYNLISLANGDEVKLSQAYRQPLFQQLGIDD